MSIFDKMMEKDPAVLAKKEQKKLEVKRLSELFGEPFIVTCAPISQKQMEYVAENAKTMQEQRVYFILECCKVEGRKFSDKAFLDWTGALKGEDAVRKLFYSGEIYALYSEVSKLSGYGEDAVTELKN